MQELESSNTEAKESRGKRILSYLRGRGLALSPRAYFVDSMSAMALGLFASLLIGTIFSTIGKYIPDTSVIYDFLALLGGAGAVTGAVIGIAIAHSLKAPLLVMLSSGAVGYFANGYGTTVMLEGVEKSVTAGPLGAFVAVIVAVELGKLVSGITKVDILVTPATTLAVGALLTMLLCPPIAYITYWLGYFVNFATTILPLLMGIVISVTVGIILTLPISSAAICAMIGISGLAGGAATAGCCAQMVGFAVISYRENKAAGLVAQGLGTSMLQMGNIIKNPWIWVPPTLASAITGPLSTCLFKLECTGVSAGMGTCGLVGPLGIFSDMGFGFGTVISVLLVCIVLPAALSLIFAAVMRRLGLIKDGDMTLSLK